MLENTGQAGAFEETLVQERARADLLARDPLVTAMVTYLYNIDDIDDPQYEAARFKETKAAAVLRALDRVANSLRS
jgi:hypothetical protein